MGMHERDSAPGASAATAPGTTGPQPGVQPETGVVTAATVGVVAVGALIFEAALLPGLILGVAAVLAPKYMPKIGSALNPLFRSTVRGAYRLGQKSREAFAEAQEHMHDIAAEVSAETGARSKPASPTHSDGAGDAVVG